MKALQYVNVGYQRILTFECQSGGFNWWEGDNPGNPILSALAIMMLRDTAQVYPAVDTKVIDRAFKYLEKIQRGDGSWQEEQHLHAGNENLGGGALRSTCYISWALHEGGYGKTGAAKKSVEFIERKADGENDLYTMAMCANALAASGEGKGTLKGLLERIAAAAKREKEQIHWEQAGQTLVNSGGIAAHVEVTALVALAYIKAGFRTNDIALVVNWLAGTKDPNGNWGYNTQATVLALKTFLAAATLDTGDTNADVAVSLNGKEIGRRHFDNFNKDVVWQVEVPASQLGGENRLALNLTGTGNLGYQVVSSHFVPWGKRGDTTEPLSIAVRYDRTNLKVNETVTVNATLVRHDQKAGGMVLVTLGVPPGFDVLTEDLDALKNERMVRNYELTGRQLLLYFDEFPVEKPVDVKYRLQARYPVAAQTGESEARLYYQSDVRSTARPATLTVN